MKVGILNRRESRRKLSANSYSRKMNELVRATENPIRVFISSQMSPEHAPLRNIACDTVESQGFIPWVFEQGPASDQSAPDTYLKGVELCEIFLWISKGITGIAVEREVRHAIQLGKPIFAFFIETTFEDDRTQNLRAEVQKGATTKPLENVNSLADELLIALRGFVARSIRQERSVDLTKVLMNLKTSSIARCLARFTYVQIGVEVAAQMASDISVGAVDTLNNVRGVSILVGELGAGKTLAGERAHQNAINYALVLGGPFPIWHRADLIQGTIENLISKCTPKSLDVAESGVHLVIDGLDETNLDYGRLLEEAQTLAASWKNTTIIFTTRPTQNIVKHPLALSMPMLSDDQILRLAALAGTAPYRLDSLPFSLREAISRPLFAILLGKAIQDNIATDAPQALVAHLVSDTIYRHKVTPAMQDALTEIAIKIIDRKGRIPIVEAPGLDSLLTSGMLEIDRRTIGFSLTVIGQWFAAIAIRSGKLKIATLGSEVHRLLLWRETIAMAVAVSPEETKFKLLNDVAQFAPELFAWLIEEAIPIGYTEAVAELPSENESGQQIRAAMLGSARALGKLATYVTPVRATGVLPPLGIRIERNGISSSWWAPDDFPLNEEVMQIGSNPTWNFPHLHWERNGGQSGWAWRLVLSAIQNEMKDAMHKRSLPIAPPLRSERDWTIARAILDFDPYATAISAREFSKQIERIDEISPLLECEKIMFNTTSIFSAELIELHERLSDIEMIEVPWPQADRTGGRSIVDNFSNAQLKERIKMIFSTAMDAHRWYSENLLRTLSGLSPTHAIRPARCDIHILQSGDAGVFGTTLMWSFEPLRDNEKEYVNIDWIDDEHFLMPNQTHWDDVRALRPNSNFFGHSHHHSILEIFEPTPISHLVYQWLSEDLKTLKWLK